MDDDGRQAPSTGLQRLLALYQSATRRVEPNEDPPPAPRELVEWAQYTMLGTAAGIAIGGAKQALEHRQAGPVQVPEGLPSKLHAARYVAENNTRRLSKTLNESIKGGARIGSLAALFFGTQRLAAVYRDAYDMYNSVIAATLSGTLFGALGRRSCACT